MMTSQAVAKPKLATTYVDFLAGEVIDFGPAWAPYRFSYADARWYALDALSPGRPVKDATYNFALLPDWMRAEAKECIASAWLERGLSAGTLNNHVKALGHIGKAFPRFGASLLELTPEHAKQFTRYLERALLAGDLAAVTCVNMVITLRSVFETLRRLPRHAGRRCTFTPRAPKMARQQWAVKKQAFNAPPEKVIPDETIAALLRACRAEEEAYQAALDGCAGPGNLLLLPGSRGARNAGPRGEQAFQILRDRAIKAQLVKFALCFGRRISALCALPVGPELEVVRTNRGRALLLYIHESKIKGSTEVVRAPDALVDVALDALEKTLRYTAAYRSKTPELQGSLFLVSSQGHNPVKVLTGEDLNRYLSGQGKKGREHSLVSRYQIESSGEVAHITSHNFRTTRITKIAEMAGPSVASQDAGHLDVNTTSRHYIAATGPLRREAERALRDGRVSGEAAERIAGTRAEGERISPRLISRLMNQDKPLVVNVTRYGVCFLQAETGPCPTGNPCWLGAAPDSADVASGRGCEWQGLTSAAIPALERDEKALIAQIESYRADARFQHFVSNLERRLSIVRQLARARDLKSAGADE